MHRKVKTRLSFVITIAMITTTIIPASAEELSTIQQPAEKLSIVEAIEPETESVFAQEQNVVKAELVQQPVEPNMEAEESIEDSTAVDETAPTISGVANGQVYYGDQTITITDENLRTVTVNGEAVAISGNSVDITLKPSEEAYKIIAEDTAGNVTEYMIEVLETWVRDGITTDGKRMLRSARMYKLGSGQWTVDGDRTVYSGDGTFYVKDSGEYDFKKK